MAYETGNILAPDTSAISTAETSHSIARGGGYRPIGIGVFASSRTLIGMGSPLDYAGSVLLLFLPVFSRFTETGTGVFLLELLDPAGFGYPCAAFSRKDRVTSGTDGYLDLLHGGPGHEGVPAGAGHLAFTILGMYILFIERTSMKKLSFHSTRKECNTGLLKKQ